MRHCTAQKTARIQPAGVYLVEGEGEKNRGKSRDGFMSERATGGRQQAEALQVEPQKMASLQQIPPEKQRNITVERFLAELLRKLQQWGGVDGGHWPAQLAAELQDRNHQAAGTV